MDLGSRRRKYFIRVGSMLYIPELEKAGPTGEK